MCKHTPDGQVKQLIIKNINIKTLKYEEHNLKHLNTTKWMIEC
jgi:hypothetical protein